MSTVLQIVAVADGYPHHDYLIRGYEAFLKSSRRYGFEPVMLGWGHPWQGLGSKPKLLKKAIETGVVRADHILFCDSFDVAFAMDPTYLLERYKNHLAEDFRIVWNAEKNCFPEANWAEHHPPSKTPWRFLNSGLSIGDTQAYHQIFTEMKVDEWPDDYQKTDGSWHHTNDQHLIMEKFLFGQCGDHELKMGLDTECSMFQTIIGLENSEFDLIDFEGMLFHNLVTDQIPGAIHFNGPAKTAGLMEPILKHLDL